MIEGHAEFRAVEFRGHDFARPSVHRTCLDRHKPGRHRQRHTTFAIGGRERHALHRPQQTLALHHDAVRVILRDDRLVVRVISFDRLRDESQVGNPRLLRKDRHTERLLTPVRGKQNFAGITEHPSHLDDRVGPNDEFARAFGFVRSAAARLRQRATICRCHGHRLPDTREQRAIQDIPVFILRLREVRQRDEPAQIRTPHRKLLRLKPARRERVFGQSGNAKFRVARNQQTGVSLGFDAHRRAGHVLHHAQQVFRRQRDGAGLADVRQHLARDREVEARACELQLVALRLKQAVLKDGHGLCFRRCALH